MISARELVLAIGFFIVAMAWTKPFSRKGRATGKITGFEWDGAKGNRVKKPRIEFEVNGTEYSFLPALFLRGDSNENRLGEQVAVAYNLSDPRDADVASPVRNCIPPAVLTILYLIALYIVFTS